jgi:hypothetical protein
MRQNILDQAREVARQPYAFPGGYRQWLLMADTGLICPECARREWRQVVRATKAKQTDWPDKSWRVEAIFINWEGPACTCDHCGVSHDSEYGDCDDENVG